MQPNHSLTHRLAVLLLLPALAVCGGDSSSTDPGGDGDGGDTPPPAAPSGLTATPASGTRIVLSWQDNSADETGFRVEASPDGAGSWSALATTVADVTTFEDSGLDEGTERFYRVAAVGAGGASSFSNTAAATTPSGPLAVATEVTGVIRDVLPPPGTPLDQRNLYAEVQAVADGAAAVAGVDTVLVLLKQLTAQIVYADGTVHLFINNRPHGIEELEASPAPAPTFASAPRLDPRPPLRNDGPPGSRRAVVTSYDGGAAEAQQVASMLTNAGYQVVGLGASLDDMKQYTNLGVLHLDTHGVAYKALSRDANGDIVRGQNGKPVFAETSFALQTSTFLDGAGLNDPDVIQDLKSGSLAIANTTNAAGQSVTSIAITEGFIARYWSFDDGVVMLHACYGGSGPFANDLTGGVTVDPSILRLTMLGAGARVVVAFDAATWTSFALPTILHFFDRMLGANEWEPESPPLRPFDVDEVYADAGERDLLQFTRPQYTLGPLEFLGNEVNVVYDRVPGRTTLAPSIRSMDIVDDEAAGDGELTLHGLFGSREGQVLVEESAVPIDSWSEDRIVARVPFEALGSAGPVKVVWPQQVESNEAPLTEWRGELTATTELVGNLKAEATVDFRFRADVHPFRQSLSDDPEHRSVITYLNPASSGTSRGSGTHTYPDGDQIRLSGSYPLRILTKAEIDGGGVQPDESALGARIRLDPAAGQAEICVLVWGEVDITGTGPNGSVTRTAVVVFGSAPFIINGSVSGILGCATVGMDDDTYVIDALDESFTEDEVTYRIKWDQLRPYAAPDDQTAG